MASRRAQDRVMAAQLRERLAHRRQSAEEVLTRAAAALVAAEELQAEAQVAAGERDRLLAAASWVLRPEDAAAVLGVSAQRVRAARKLFRGEREALAAVADTPDPAVAAVPAVAPTVDLSTVAGEAGGGQQLAAAAPGLGVGTAEVS